jgi:hypothetical protein
VATGGPGPGIGRASPAGVATWLDAFGMDVLRSTRLGNRDPPLFKSWQTRATGPLAEVFSRA